MKSKMLEAYNSIRELCDALSAAMKEQLVVEIAITEWIQEIVQTRYKCRTALRGQGKRGAGGTCAFPTFIITTDEYGCDKHFINVHDGYIMVNWIPWYHTNGGESGTYIEFADPNFEKRLLECLS